MCFWLFVSFTIESYFKKIYDFGTVAFTFITGPTFIYLIGYLLSWWIYHIINYGQNRLYLILINKQVKNNMFACITTKPTSPNDFNLNVPSNLYYFRKRKRQTYFLSSNNFLKVCAVCNVCVVCRAESSYHHHSDVARAAQQNSRSQPHGGDSALSQRTWAPGVWPAAYTPKYCLLFHFIWLKHQSRNRTVGFRLSFALTHARRIRRAAHQSHSGFSLTLISPFRFFFYLLC